MYINDCSFVDLSLCVPIPFNQLTRNLAFRGFLGTISVLVELFCSMLIVRVPHSKKCKCENFFITIYNVICILLIMRG